MSLTEYLTANLSTPFKWGEHDCTLFVTNWLKQSVGVDFLEGLPTWKTERQALRIVKSVGGLEAACDARLTRIPNEQAKDGDVGIINNSLCLFAGSRVVATGINGLMYFDRGEARCAWRYC